MHLSAPDNSELFKGHGRLVMSWSITRYDPSVTNEMANQEIQIQSTVLHS